MTDQKIKKYTSEADYNRAKILKAPTRAATAYASISAHKESQVLLIPGGTGSTPKSYVSAPAGNQEEALQYIKSFIDPTNGGIGKVKTAVGFGEDVFRALNTARTTAADAVGGILAEYLSAGGTYDQAFLTRLFEARKAVQQEIRKVHVPSYNFQVIDNANFARIERLKALAEFAPSTSAKNRTYEKISRELVEFPVHIDATPEGIKIAKKYADKLQQVGNILMVADFARHTSNVFTAQSHADAEKSLAKLAKFGGEIVVSAAARGAATYGLAILLGASPAGWVVIAGGIIGFGAGVYFEKKAYPWLLDMINEYELAPTP